MKSKITIISLKYFGIYFISFFWFNLAIGQKATVYQLFEDDLHLNVVQSKTISKNTSLKSNAAKEDLQNFLELNSSLKSTVYVKNNTVVKSTDAGVKKPIKIKFNNITPFQKLDEDNFLYTDVELITINIKTLNDLNNRFDLKNANHFQNLKYVFVKCYFDCSVNQIEQFVLNAEPEVIIYFTIVNPS